MSINAGRLWTAEERNDLRKEINAGASLETIVEIHGRTPYAIISQLQQMGVLVQVGMNYHLINPDPWALGEIVRGLQGAVTKGAAK